MICLAVLSLVVVAISAGLFYVFLVWNFDYWKKRGVKGTKPTALYGSFPNMIKQKRNISYDMQDIYKQFREDEDFVGVYSIRTPQLMVVNPKLAHDVYVKDFKNFRDNEATTWIDEKKTKVLSKNPFLLRNEEWKERRQEITPGFTSNRIKAVYPVTQKICEKLVNYIREKCLQAEKDGIDAKDLSLRYTSEVVTDCVLGIKAESLTDNPTPILQMTKELFQQSSTFVYYSFLAGLWPRIKTFYKVRFFNEKSEDFFMDLMTSAIDMRRKQRVERLDFLNFILQLQEKKHLTDDDLASHSMTFLLDGFETSASVIMHCLYQLAKNPTTQEKLFEEIFGNLTGEGELEFEKLSELPYLDQCVHESIRITPPLLFSTKLCTEKCELTNKNGKTLQMEPDDIVLIPVFCFHHDERYYPNPEEFIPERFNPENGGTKKYRELGVFYPFGDGPRICLGMRFALTQTKAAVTAIVKNFEIHLNPKTKTDNELDPTYFIGSLDGGVWLNFKNRK